MINKPFKKSLAILFLMILIAGVLIPPVAADYWSGTQTSINVSMWRDMTNNLTNVRDNMLPSNISMAIAASGTNISALRGNGTVVLNNATSLPWYNLTASYSRIGSGGTQALSFITPSAGTYLIQADLRGNVSLSTYFNGLNTNWTQYALCDANNTAIVTNSERMGARVTDTSNFTATTRHFTWIYTNSTGSSEVGVCGLISQVQAGRVGASSDGYGRSVLTWMRMP